MFHGDPAWPAELDVPSNRHGYQRMSEFYPDPIPVAMAAERYTPRQVSGPYYFPSSSGMANAQSHTFRQASGAHLSPYESVVASSEGHSSVSEDPLDDLERAALLPSSSPWGRAVADGIRMSKEQSPFKREIARCKRMGMEPEASPVAHNGATRLPSNALRPTTPTSRSQAGMVPADDSSDECSEDEVEVFYPRSTRRREREQRLAKKKADSRTSLDPQSLPFTPTRQAQAVKEEPTSARSKGAPISIRRPGGSRFQHAPPRIRLSEYAD